MLGLTYRGCRCKTVLNYHLTFSQIDFLSDQLVIVQRRGRWFLLFLLKNGYETVHSQKVNEFLLKEGDEFLGHLTTFTLLIVNKAIFDYRFYLRFFFDCGAKVDEVAKNVKTFTRKVLLNQIDNLFVLVPLDRHFDHKKARFELFLQGLAKFGIFKDWLKLIRLFSLLQRNLRLLWLWLILNYD